MDMLKSASSVSILSLHIPQMTAEPITARQSRSNSNVTRSARETEHVIKFTKTKSVRKDAEWKTSERATINEHRTDKEPKLTHSNDILTAMDPYHGLSYPFLDMEANEIMPTSGIPPAVPEQPQYTSTPRVSVDYTPRLTKAEPMASRQPLPLADVRRTQRRVAALLDKRPQVKQPKVRNGFVLVLVLLVLILVLLLFFFLSFFFPFYFSFFF